MDFSGKIRKLVGSIATATVVCLCLADGQAMWLRKQRFEEMMDFWVPVVFGAFKLLVLGTCMFLAIKSHYDGAKKEKEEKETKGP